MKLLGSRYSSSMLLASIANGLVVAIYAFWKIYVASTLSYCNLLVELQCTRL